MARRWWRSRPSSAEGGKVTPGGGGEAPIDIGIPPAALPALIEAATGPPEDLTDARRHELERDLLFVRAQLGVGAGALDRFLRDIGEAAVPPERQPGRLAEMAARHKDLLARVERTASADPRARGPKEEGGAARLPGSGAGDPAFAASLPLREASDSRLGKGSPGGAARPEAGRRGASGGGGRERSRAASGRSGGPRRPPRGLGRGLSWIAWGFTGGLAAALAIQQAFVVPLGRAGIVLPSWNFRPAPPLDVPAVALTALSGGLWGTLLASLLLARRSRRGGGYWLTSASFGAVVPTLAAWLIGSGAKALPSGTAWPDLLLTLVFNCLWGLGTALILLL